MTVKLNSATFFGVDAIPVNVEVFITHGVPGTMIVGLPDSSTREAKDRVVAAIKNSKFEYPVRKITINLSPADIRKAGTSLDLPLAVGILISAGLLRCRVALENYIMAGELSLTGGLNKIKSIIALGILAKKLNKCLLIPSKNKRVASLLGVDFHSFDSLSGVCEFIEGKKSAPETVDELPDNPVTLIPPCPDLMDIKGHEFAKRALEVAVSGRHNILFSGPPGSGKTMLAQAAQGIMPGLSVRESIETSNIYSFSRKRTAGEEDDLFISKRPFISVHHSITTAGLIGGGGNNPVPGDISLAHNGILFIDEFSELSKKTLDSLRQPLQDGVVNLSRSRFSAIIPCDFMLIAAMNPCDCGYYGDKARECECSPADIFRFYKKLSGPVLDRIDMFVEVYSVPAGMLMENTSIEGSAEVGERVLKTRKFQEERLIAGGFNEKYNSRLNESGLEKHINITKSALSFYNEACKKLDISSRGYFRTLKVARTVADMEGREAVQEDSILEALNYKKTRLMK